MSEVKWIKIVVDIFDDEKILIIESMPEADSILVIWFKLLCRAGKMNNDGVFMMNGMVPYTDEMFAALFRRPLSTVRLAMKTFEQLGMIEIQDGVVMIPNWEKHQNLDALEASRSATRNRVAKFREKQRKLASGNDENCNATCNVTDGVTVTDSVTPHAPQMKRSVTQTDKDIDKDIDISCAESFDKSSTQKQKKPHEPPEPAVYTLPLNDGTTYGVTASEIANYVQLYPAVNVDQEIRKMIGWLESHPQRRKTKRGVRAFITNWLSKSQDRCCSNNHGFSSNNRGCVNTVYANPEDFY